jgi:hypothetical protein
MSLTNYVGMGLIITWEQIFLNMVQPVIME